MKIEGICHQHSHAKGNLTAYSSCQVKVIPNKNDPPQYVEKIRAIEWQIRE